MDGVMRVSGQYYCMFILCNPRRGIYITYLYLLPPGGSNESPGRHPSFQLLILTSPLSEIVITPPPCPAVTSRYLGPGQSRGTAAEREEEGGVPIEKMAQSDLSVHHWGSSERIAEVYRAIISAPYMVLYSARHHPSSGVINAAVVMSTALMEIETLSEEWGEGFIIIIIIIMRLIIVVGRPKPSISLSKLQIKSTAYWVFLSLYLSLALSVSHTL